VLFGQILALYGVGLWLPQLIRNSLGVRGVMSVAVLTALPYTLATVAMVLWGQGEPTGAVPAACTGRSDGDRRAGAGGGAVP